MSQPVLPQILAVEGPEGQGSARSVGAVPEEHDAMDVVAARHRAPLETDHGRESAWSIVFVGGGDVFTPDGGDHLRLAEPVIPGGRIADDRCERLHSAFGAGRADACRSLQSLCHFEATPL